MGKPKVKKSKSGTQNDSVQVNKKKLPSGDGGFLSDRILKISKNK